MFTGIIEEVGTIKSMPRAGAAGKLTIGCSKVLGRNDSFGIPTQIGDSIAVNGICLTVTDMTDSSFTADVMPETIRRSSLSQLRPGGRVNLERAMPAYGRFGGHFVSGHIDGTGTIMDLHREENAVWIDINCGDGLWRQIVEKGSIAIDGISLTVAKADSAGAFSVSIIPHTLAETALSGKGAGDIVNLETDVLGKYVEKMVNAGYGAGSSETEADRRKKAQEKDKLLLELL